MTIRKLTLREIDKNGKIIENQKEKTMRFAGGTEIEVVEKHSPESPFSINIDKISLSDHFLVDSGIKYAIISMLSKDS